MSRAGRAAFTFARQAVGVGRPDLAEGPAEAAEGRRTHPRAPTPWGSRRVRARRVSEPASEMQLAGLGHLPSRAANVPGRRSATPRISSNGCDVVSCRSPLHVTMRAAGAARGGSGTPGRLTPPQGRTQVASVTRAHDPSSPQPAGGRGASDGRTVEAGGDGSATTATLACGPWSAAHPRRFMEARRRSNAGEHSISLRPSSTSRSRRQRPR